MKNKTTLGKVLKYIGRQKLLIPFSLLSALINVALGLYIPILIGNAIDLAIGEGRVFFDGIKEILIKIGVSILIAALAQWIMSAINNRIVYHVVKDVRVDAFNKLERLPLSYLDKKPHGDIVSRVISDTDQFAEGLLLGFTQIFTSLITIAGTLVLLLTINWKIGLVVALLTPLSLFIARFIANRTHSMFKEQAKAKANQTAFIGESISNQKTIIAFSRENETAEAFNELNEKLGKASLRAIFFSSLTNPMTRFVNSLVYAAVALTGALSVVATAGTATPFTVGELSCLLSYATKYTGPFNEISGVFAEFQHALVCAGRVLELIEEKSECPDKDGAIKIEAPRGDVSFQDVSFSYTEDKSLIEALSLSVKGGERVAIVGPTGCGKTTLINLIMRFYDVNSGKISVDAVDIRDATRESLRTNFGMVLQDTWLTSGTVRDNIAFGKPDASDEEIIAAAKAAHAHSFIKRLSDGYDTVIGEGGGKLSQGQKQLICIARIMLTLPPMLILDEATSSIDTRTEMKIQDAFLALMKGRTSFIVAHRLSTIKEADIILVMKDGRILETGKHEELLSKGGFFSELYNSQFA